MTTGEVVITILSGLILLLTIFNALVGVSILHRLDAISGSLSHPPAVRVRPKFLTADGRYQANSMDELLQKMATGGEISDEMIQELRNQFEAHMEDEDPEEEL